ncbi:MAG TPA: hypothetical protein VJ960_04920 [Oceanipulchritudo sp.]|nr:hypothetical protein [Oceanipulchritudo sp.]
MNATKALKYGTNDLVIEVANTWQNRLVGDGLIPVKQRKTKTNIPHFDRQERKGKNSSTRLCQQV